MKKSRTIFVACDGNDTASGTFEFPFATLERAQKEVRNVCEEQVAVSVCLRQGTYYLREPFILRGEDSGTPEMPVTYSAFNQEKVVISGAKSYQLKWTKRDDQVWQAKLPEAVDADQLFIQGVRYTMARYPNHNSENKIFNGYASDCVDRSKTAQWKNPQGGFIHALTKQMWGSYHYEITGKNLEGDLLLRGGWQDNRRSEMHSIYRYAENIYEELDTPGEWYLDRKNNMLFVYPMLDVDLNLAHIELAVQKNLFRLQGTADKPVRYIKIKGLTFTHTRRTFMETSEPLLRSDWCIYRGGAIVVEDAEHCSIECCQVANSGGNGIFMNGYNRHIKVSQCLLAEIGASAVIFAGMSESVRSPLFNYDDRQSSSQIDHTPGPVGKQYPQDCLIEDCLIYQSGQYEKQSAGVEISAASRITVRHCTIYDLPRAGINISEGTFGGHLIEFCDVFDTVQETGDHGSFNSWGRDRFWGLTDQESNPEYLKKTALLDAVELSTIRNSRWRCDHGWDIDLDDGSSHYHIYNNLCLNGGIKLREGFYRRCENNIIVNNSIHVHVWYPDSEDIIKHNILFGDYAPIAMPEKWGRLFDWNIRYQPGLKAAQPAAALMNLSGMDQHSCQMDIQFAEPFSGNYQVVDDPKNAFVFHSGFTNFPMHLFGVQTPWLKKLASRPRMPAG